MLSALGLKKKPQNTVLRADSSASKRFGKKDIIEERVMLRSSQEVTDRVGQEVVAGNEQEIFQYSMPVAELGFGDLLKEHTRGERMPGVAVIQKSMQSRDEIMRDLEQMQPDRVEKQIKLPKKFVLPLVNKDEKVCLNQFIKKFDPNLPYIHIRKMYFVLTPLSSFFDDFTNVNAMILDMRLLNRPKRQSTRLNSNVDYRGHVSLDYCFHFNSLDKFFIAISSEVSLMQTGEEWGTILIKAEIDQMDFPKVAEYQPVAVVAHLPHSGMQSYKFDPTHIDLTIRDQHRNQLLQMYKDGDIADPTVPLVVKTGKAKYSQTTVNGQQGNTDKDGNVDWSQFDFNKPAKQNIEEISNDPSEEEIPAPMGKLDRMKEAALLKQRFEAKVYSDRIIEANRKEAERQQQLNESDTEGSELSFEKKQSKPGVSFVRDVREDD